MNHAGLLGKHWHHLPVEQAVELLETNLERGLDLFEIKHRQERFGPSVLTPRKTKSPWLRRRRGAVQAAKH